MIVHRSCFPFVAVVLVACGSSSGGSSPSAGAGGASANAGGSSGSSAATGGSSSGGAGTAGAGGGASGGACGALEACCSAPDYPDKSCAPTAHMLAMQNGEATCAALLQTVQAKGLCSGSLGAGGMGAGGSGAGGVSSGGTSSGGGAAGVMQSATCMAEAKGFAACGGDPSGTWKIVNVCSPVDATGHAYSCPPQPPQGKSITWLDGGSGTYTLAGGTFTETDFSVTAYLIDDTPKSCLGDPNCAAFCKSLEGAGKMTASDDGTTCHCEGYIIAPKPATASAPYTISGNQIDLAGSKVDFCVTGTTLRLAMKINGPGKEIIVAEKM